MFGEMAGDGPLFGTAETEFQLLSMHCDYAGFTYKSDEIEISSEPRRPDGGEGVGDRQYSLRDLAPSLCECGLDLLSRMLCGDWRKRITMAEALEHEFFTGCQCTFRVAPPPPAVEEGAAYSLRPDSVYSSFVSDPDREGGPGLPAGLALLVQEHQNKKRGALKRARCSLPSSPPRAKRERVA
jgi:serine/threonine protein kinase